VATICSIPHGPAGCASRRRLASQDARCYIASYQTSGEEPGLDEAQDIVIDTERLEQRATELGHDAALSREAIIEALHAPRKCCNLIALREFVDKQAQLNDEVNFQVAMTNATFPMADLELPLWREFDVESTDDISVEFRGLVTVAQDDERIYGETRSKSMPR